MARIVFLCRAIFGYIFLSLVSLPSPRCFYGGIFLSIDEE